MGWKGLGTGHVEEGWYDCKGVAKRNSVNNSGSKLWGTYMKPHI